MKYSIEFHEERLKAGLAFLQNKDEELKRLRSSYEDRLVALRILKRQIDTAKARGKDGFDAKKFLVKRKPAGATA